MSLPRPMTDWRASRTGKYESECRANASLTFHSHLPAMGLAGVGLRQWQHSARRRRMDGTINRTLLANTRHQRTPLARIRAGHYRSQFSLRHRHTRLFDVFSWNLNFSPRCLKAIDTFRIGQVVLTSSSSGHSIYNIFSVALIDY